MQYGRYITAGGVTKQVKDPEAAVASSIAANYVDLTFPVSKGTPCTYEGVRYVAAVDIASSESFTAAHWTAETVQEMADGMQQDISDLKSQITEENASTLPYIEHNITWEIGGINADGYERDDQTDRIRSNIIPVSDGYTLDIVNGSNTYVYRYIAYDANGNSLGTSYGWYGYNSAFVASGVLFSPIVLNGISYIRAIVKDTTSSGTIDDDNAAAAFVLTAPTPVDNTFKAIRSIEPLVEFNAKDFSFKYGSVSGGTRSYSQNRIVSDIMDVYAGDYINIPSNDTDIGFGVGKYDTSGAFVAYDTGWYGYSQTIVASNNIGIYPITTDGKIRIVVRKTDNSDITSADITSISSKIFCYRKNSSQFSGKKINVIGDSYVANNNDPVNETWHYLFAQKYGLFYRNYGVNGCKFVVDETNSVINRYESMNADADFVCVIAGHNEAAKCGSTLSESDYKALLRTFFGGLVDMYPLAKIVMFTPWGMNQVESLGSGTIAGFNNQANWIIDVCKEYNIPVFDSRRSNVFMGNTDFMTEYCQGSSDFAHLNAKGHKRFLPTAEQFMLGI